MYAFLFVYCRGTSLTERMKAAKWKRVTEFTGLRCCLDL